MIPKVIIHDIRQILRDTSEISHIHILQIIEDHTNFTFFSKINKLFNEELSNCDTSRLNSKSNNIRGGLIYLRFLNCYQLYLWANVVDVYKHHSKRLVFACVGGVYKPIFCRVF